MSQKFPNFFTARGYTNSVKTYRMSATDCTIARSALTDDIHSFVLNGISSFAAAINSIGKSNYSWTFIQAYYSLFFFARAFIAINDHGIIYINEKPFGIRLRQNEMFRKLEGNSHDVVLNEFKLFFSSNVLLSSNIDNKSPVDWFNQNRNHINYKQSPFTDPTPPLELCHIENNLRNWINAYSNDSAHIYTFDPCHCYLAYPLKLLNTVFDYYLDNDLRNPFIDNEKLIFLRKNISDSDGPIVTITNKIKEISIIE